MTGLPVPVRGVSARVAMNEGGRGGHYAYVVADLEPPGPAGTEMLNPARQDRLPAGFLTAVRDAVELGAAGGGGAGR
ncbi:hypothetical protein [Streptomyces yangpuensis]|uniref:hypothetical protein n=1 Tax=Streptomyces yangpuensis TaxID=1648182 RepID=UPI00368A819D